MRVLPAGVCAAAGVTRPALTAAAVPSPSDATPPARKLRRDGPVVTAASLQHRQVRKNFRRLVAWLITSSLDACLKRPTLPGHPGALEPAVSPNQIRILLRKRGTRHGLMDMIASISTEIWLGSATMPTAERAWRPDSPNTSTNRSEQPLMTFGC